jgi:hypothetical protein
MFNFKMILFFLTFFFFKKIKIILGDMEIIKLFEKVLDKVE